MRTELNQSEIIYNFNTDYDDTEQTYSFILMTVHNNHFYQIGLSYLHSQISVWVMKPYENGRISVDYTIKPRSINLTVQEISNTYEIKKALNEILADIGCTSGELHNYMTTNFDEFLKQLLQDAQNRGLIDNIGSIPVSMSFMSFFKNSNDIL